MANPSVATVKSGTIPFTYQGETFSTYYHVFGDLEKRTKDPLVVLHGGPGLVHDYLVPFSDLTASADIPVILYDQIGNGRSTHLRDKPAEFWKIDLFIEELENLLSHFGIRDGFSLAGHSWGGILAAEFEVQRQPKGLKKLILTNSLASIALWMQSNMQLLQTFPKEVQEGVMGGMKSPEKYEAALRELHRVHGCILDPQPEEFVGTLSQVFSKDGDPTVAHAPILAGWSIIDRLNRVRVPTLVLNGRKDIAQDFVVAPFFEKIPKVKWLTFEASSHTPFWEEREVYFKRVKEFLELQS